jgi:hypothetical protein
VVDKGLVFLDGHLGKYRRVTWTCWVRIKQGLEVG